MTKTGVLLLHGFGGNVDDVEPLKAYLEQRGYLVECPLLPGHGKTKRELSHVSYQDWINEAEKYYLRLSKKCERVFAVGLSMGGLLAINLWNYGFSGLVTINMPVYYWNPRVIAENLRSDFWGYGNKYLTAATDKSLASMVEFQRLLTKTKPLLSCITCRTLVIQAFDDDTVHYKSADYILRKVRADRSCYMPVEGGHMLFQSLAGGKVCEAVDRFMNAG